jgi:6-methylsalicylate decarboxylase
MPIIDVHHHFVPEAYKEALIAAGDACPPPGFQGPLRNWSAARSLEDMEEGGAQSAVLSITTPGIHLGDDAKARKLARACNEAGAKLASDHKGRFGLFAALPLPDIDGALAEIAYALDQLKADGIGLYTNYRAKWLGHQDFAPILAELDRRNAVVFVHPTSVFCCSGMQPEYNDATIEYGTDTTRTIGSLVFSGAASHRRNIRWIFCHGGGTMPYLIERFITQEKRMEHPELLPDGVLHELQRFHYDIAQVAHPAPLSCLKGVVPTTQIVFGTDYPYGIGSLGHAKGLHGCDFTAAEFAAIERENALRLLPRFRS